MYTLILKFTFVFLAFFPLAGKDVYQIEEQTVALEKAISLPNQGILKEKNGFFYLDVPNAFIESVTPLLKIPGKLKPLPTTSQSLGAHIRVFDTKENVIPEEIGLAFTFKVKEIRSLKLQDQNGLKKLWVIALTSEDLENLRQKYGCSTKLRNQDYHITLGNQLPVPPENWQERTELSSLNFSDEPTLGLFTVGDFVTIDNPELLKTITKVDAIGQLKLKDNGYVYLDVSNAFIENALSELPTCKEFEPVPTNPQKIGAHISVMYEDEMIEFEIWNLNEVGEWFTFEVKELRYVDRSFSEGKTRLWLLAATAPALERLRTCYGLKAKLKNHDFHITLGKEKLEASKPAAKHTKQWPKAA